MRESSYPQYEKFNDDIFYGHFLKHIRRKFPKIIVIKVKIWVIGGAESLTEIRISFLFCDNKGYHKIMIMHPFNMSLQLQKRTSIC